MNPFLFALLSSVAVTGTTYLVMVLSKSSPTLFLPNLIRFCAAAIVLAIFQGFRERTLPPFSIRLLNSAVVAGILFMAIPSVLWWRAICVVPLSFVGLTIALVPLWINIFANFKKREYQLAGISSLVGLWLAGYHVVSWESVMASIFAMLCAAVAGCLARRLYWIHASVNLNIWSMLCGAVFLVPLSWLMGEMTFLQNWQAVYWRDLIVLTIVFTTAGGLLYRQIAFRLSGDSLGFCLAICGTAPLFVDWCLGTPPSAVGCFGTAVALIPMFILGRRGAATHWMVHYLAGSNRSGDRLDVDLLGFVKSEKGASGNIRVKSISIGGLGFESDIYCPVGDRAVVHIPMGKNFTQVYFDTICAYTSKMNQGKYAWTGGLAFVKMNLETTQILAEFVARLAMVAPSEEPAIKIRRESA